MSENTSPIPFGQRELCQTEKSMKKIPLKLAIIFAITCFYFAGMMFSPGGGAITGLLVLLSLVYYLYFSQKDDSSHPIVNKILSYILVIESIYIFGGFALLRYIHYITPSQYRF